jgi:type VI secretion system protein VasJ
MSTGTLDTADTSNTGVATPPPGPPLDWDDDKDLVWIKREIEKSTLFGRESAPVDWAGIAERASGFLTRTTDWVLVVATARATVQCDGLSALPHAIDRLTHTVATSWETMHPLPAGSKRRASSLSWFVEGLAEAVNIGGADSTHDDLKSSLEKLSALDEALRPLMEEYPGVRVLRESLKQAIEKAAPVVVTPEAVAPAVIAPPPIESRQPVRVAAPPAPAAEFPPPIDDVDAADRVLSKAREALTKVADARQSADGTDALAFRLRRVAAWLRQTTELALDESGRLAGLQGPSADDHQHLRSALDTDHKGVVTVAEQLLERYPLWLDANYLTFLALGRGGPSFRAAADTVRAETLALVQRLPRLLDLEFSDEVPLASPDTRDWLQSELAKLAGAEPATVSRSSAPAKEDELAAAERTAGELAAQGQLEESFKVLDDGIRDAPSGRERFRWRLAAGRLAAKNGRVDLAVSVLSGLHREARELRLDMWEPELWAIVLTSMLELGKKGRRERLAPEMLALLPDIEQQLSRLDLMAAVRLSKERG